MGAERRIAERAFPRRTSASIAMDNRRVEFQILDESEGGLGIFSGELHFHSGEFVTVHIAGEPERRAEVRYIAPHPRGGYHIGLMWVDGVEPASTQSDSQHAT